VDKVGVDRVMADPFRRLQAVLTCDWREALAVRANLDRRLEPVLHNVFGKRANGFGMQQPASRCRHVDVGNLHLASLKHLTSIISPASYRDGCRSRPMKVSRLARCSCLTPAGRIAECRPPSREYHDCIANRIPGFRPDTRAATAGCAQPLLRNTRHGRRPRRDLVLQRPLLLPPRREGALASQRDRATL